MSLLSFQNNPNMVVLLSFAEETAAHIDSIHQITCLEVE